jgi:uncharacterized protein (TIGR00369 family)
MSTTVGVRGAPRTGTVPAVPSPGNAPDGVSEFFGFRYEAPGVIRVTIRPELMNRAGLLSGAVAYAMVDYAMGSALWAERNEGEGIATLSISVNYLQTAREGDIICRAELDRRNRRVGMLHAAVEAEDGRLLLTAIGSYSIYPRERLAPE